MISTFFGELSPIFMKFEIVVCKLFQLEEPKICRLGKDYGWLVVLGFNATLIKDYGVWKSVNYGREINLVSLSILLCESYSKMSVDLFVAIYAFRDLAWLKGRLRDSWPACLGSEPHYIHRDLGGMTLVRNIWSLAQKWVKHNKDRNM